MLRVPYCPFWSGDGDRIIDQYRRVRRYVSDAQPGSRAREQGIVEFIQGLEREELDSLSIQVDWAMEWNIQLMLGSGGWNFIPFILCHNEPSAGGISNHFNGIIDAATGCNASGKIRHSAVIFGSVLIWYEI